MVPQSFRSHNHRAMPADTSRLFVALWPPAAVRDAALKHASRWSWPRRARLVRADKVHMTLHFLGAVPRQRVAALTAALAGVPFTPCDLRLDRGEVLPGGIAVLGCSEVPPELPALHRQLAAALREVGRTPETRPWLAHLTLARQARGAVPPPDGPDIVWPVRGCVLVESDLRPPTQYRILAEQGVTLTPKTGP
jgi:RNA 2',3'-cyclic 3'-phosphodiesterase